MFGGAPNNNPFGAAPVPSFGSAPAPRINVPAPSSAIQIPPDTRSADMLRLFESGEATDVCFLVDGQQIHAHKFPLIASSTYMHNLLCGEMSESHGDGVIPIQGVSHGVFVAVIQFLYSGHLKTNDNKTLDDYVELLKAADMYQLDRLKALCEKALCIHVTADTAARILLVAHHHSANGLKAHVKDYWFKYCNHPTLKDSIPLLEEAPALMKEVLQDAMGRLTPSF